MKKIFLLLIAMPFVLAACSDDDKDPAVFKLMANAEELVNYEGTKDYSICLTDVDRVEIASKPAGWDVAVVGDVLRVTAPARGDASADMSGEIVVAPYDTHGNALAQVRFGVMCGLLCDFEGQRVEDYLAGPTAAGENLYDGTYMGYDDERTGLVMPINTGVYGQNFGAGGTAISRWNDMVTAGYTNQCSVFYRNPAGECSLPEGMYNDDVRLGGHNGSQTFAVSFYDIYGPTPAQMLFIDDQNYLIDQMWVCNSTYTTLSMRNGDDYAKKFTSGDWFKMIVDGYKADGTHTGSVEFFLADFRTGSAEGIKYGWHKVSLSPLGEVNAIKISFDSSDKTDGYINTPAYVCIDDILVI